eukprot:549092-Hanusia_phi.AAC.1
MGGAAIESDSEELAVGIVLPLVGGFLNSIWNLPGNIATPDVIRVVRRPADVSGWSWEHFWMVGIYCRTVAVPLDDRTSPV